MLDPRPSPQPRARRAGRVAALVAVVAVVAGACLPPTGQASPRPTLAPTPTPSANPYDGVAEGAGAGLKIGYVSFGEQVPYVFEISDGIRAQAALAKAELVECDAGLDGSKVPDCMTRLAEAGVRGIIQFQGVIADPAVVCEQVADGVPVVAVEFAQEPCAATLVAVDELRAGQIAGRAVGEWAEEAWDCKHDVYLSLESAAVADRSQRRMEGYRQGFSAVCPITNERIGLAVDTEAEARRVIGEVLAEFPDASKIIVVALNGDAAIWALEAAKAAGRGDDVWVSGQGGLAPSRDRIRTDDHYLGDAAYFPERYGRTILPALLDLIAGRDVPDVLLIEPAWLDRSTIDQLYPR